MRLSSYVGNTPLIPIKLGKYTVWGKCEFMNPGGSVKDRMATYILDDAEDRKLIKKGDTLIEATSGNTGIAFAMLAAERGYKMKIVMPSNMSTERKTINFGDSFHQVNRPQLSLKTHSLDEVLNDPIWDNLFKTFDSGKKAWVECEQKCSCNLVDQEYAIGWLTN